MHEHASSPADSLKNASSNHGDQETPRAPLNPDGDLCHQYHNVPGEEEGVSAKSWHILQDCVTLRTGVKGAEGRIVPSGKIVGDWATGEGKVLLRP